MKRVIYVRLAVTKKFYYNLYTHPNILDPNARLAFSACIRPNEREKNKEKGIAHRPLVDVLRLFHVRWLTGVCANAIETRIPPISNQSLFLSHTFFSINISFVP